MKTRTVILNAPPESGKDTLADLMVKNLKATKQEFKKSLYEAMAKHFYAEDWQLKLEYVRKICTERYYKDTKRSLFSWNTGLTPRQGLVYVSEAVYKPKYGKDYFGVQAVKELVEGVNAFADGGGWWTELGPVVEASDQVVICRLYRNGFDFDGDSRNYYDEGTMPTQFKSKVQICDIHLEENRPTIALDAISRILK